MSTSAYINTLRGPVATLDNYINTLQSLQDEGGQLSAPVQTIISNWQTLTAVTTPIDPSEALAEAVTEGKKLTQTQLKTLWDSSRLTTIKDTNNEIMASTARAVLPTLKATYLEDNATHNYEVAAHRFNEVATQFTKAVTQVSPDMTADEALHLTKQQQSAYLEQALLAAQLEQNLVVLAHAATLAGTPASTTQELIALTTNWSQAHRRRVYDAWDTQGRTGRWAALIHAGATIEAPTTLSAVPTFQDLAPVEKKQVQGNVGYRIVEFDPEDEDYKKRTKVAAK